MYRPPRDRQRRVSARFEEAERIRQALEEDRLLLYCQPILDLKENEIRQHELLLRLPTTKATSRSRRAPFCTSPNASA